MRKEIYFNNSATSWPKPPQVLSAIEKFFKRGRASAGREGFKSNVTVDKPSIVTRNLLAKLINARNPKQIIFTLNATDGLNLAIKGILKENDHVIISSMEHNSIIRPLRKLEQKLNIKISIVKCKETGDVEPKDYEKEVRKNTKLICLLHASNITGTIMPVAKVGEIAKKHNITYLVDAAQSAGTVPIDVNGMNVDLLAFSGHKSLLGPTGTGALYIKEGLKLDSLKEGGTGSHSELDVQPDVFPDKYESGTINDVGIVGLGASVKFILDTSVEKIQKKRAELTSYLLQEIKHIKKIKLYGLSSVKNRTSVVSFNIHGIAPIKVGEILDKKYRIVTRTGLHCSPLAHKAIGTYPIGTVRVSFGYFNTLSEVKYLIYALKEIMKGE